MFSWPYLIICLYFWCTLYKLFRALNLQTIVEIYVKNMTKKMS